MQYMDGGGVQNTAFRIAESLAALARDVDAMQQLYRVAERYARLPRDSFVARELVNDVIGDVLMGEAKYDFECDPAPQIERHTQRRAHGLRKANAPTRKQRRARLELVPLDKAPPSALAVEPLQTVTGDHEHSAIDDAEVVSAVRERARDDGPVLQLLALYDRELVLRRDALGTGMTEWVYRAARERLVSYARASLAELARDRLDVDDDGNVAPPGD